MKSRVFFKMAAWWHCKGEGGERRAPQQRPPLPLQLLCHQMQMSRCFPEQEKNAVTVVGGLSSLYWSAKKLQLLCRAHMQRPIRLSPLMHLKVVTGRSVGSP